MQRDTVRIEDVWLDYYRFQTIVVGSGAAGLNAAARLFDFGRRDVAIVTEGLNMGTSRNTGSDKQTYYRLAENGSEPDSVAEMARSIYGGGATDKDTAFCEAAGSLRAFYRLVELGVPFPQDRHGVYVGYKTDHDPKARATSVGPATSRLMTEALEREALRREIPLFDGYEIVGICTDSSGAVAGLIAISRQTGQFVLFGCNNLVYATGGPAGLYSRSAYPGSQTGATGVALEAGALGQNMTEWQYGLASVKFRWNVSGSYQQVLPRYISTDADGNDAREFLNEYFPTKGSLYQAVFLKGYQWPFDPRKVADGGSSLIDLLVYNETELRGRRVFLDFTRNPGGAMAWDELPEEPRGYLEKLDLLFGLPIERLAKMNPLAIDLYRGNGIDIAREPLEIQVAAQHCNGGLSGDCWWQSNLKGLFPVGEVNGSHGVYRPGGSALNAGQVGSTRAAQYIAARRCEPPPDSEYFALQCGAQIKRVLQLADRLTAKKDEAATPQELRRKLGARMSGAAAFIRHPEALAQALKEAEWDLSNFADSVSCTPAELAAALRCRDLLITQICALTAMLDLIKRGGRSRGSYLVHDSDGILPAKGLDERFRFSLDDKARDHQIQQVSYKNGRCAVHWRDVRPLPDESASFEQVWNAYRNDGIIK